MKDSDKLKQRLINLQCAVTRNLKLRRREKILRLIEQVKTDYNQALRAEAKNDTL